jgi:hypothetical protein
MPNIFSTKSFQFPYRNLKFPGQHSDESILFVTREGKPILYLRLLFLTLTFTILAIFLVFLIQSIQTHLPLPSLVTIVSCLLLIVLYLTFSFSVFLMWQKSLFIITTRRLTKFIYTTPWNRYQLSLGLDKIVDTGAYQKGFIQSLTHLGYFVARSSAGNIKNFKIINISFAEDLHNYVNKLLFTFNKEKQSLDSFRPFVPHLKGEARKKFVRQLTPEYYQENN